MIPSPPPSADLQPPAQIWATRLKRLGFAPLAAALVEAAGPLNVAFASILHISQPITSAWLSDDHLSSLAALLEDEKEAAALVSYLRGGEG